MNDEMKQAAIAGGLIGFGIGLLSSVFLFGREIDKLQKKNEESFQLHKQLVNDTKKDLEDCTMNECDRWRRLSERLNFITTSKLI